MFNVGTATARNCQGLTRRELLRVGGLGIAGLAAPANAAPWVVLAWLVFGAVIFVLLSVRSPQKIQETAKTFIEG